MDSPTPVRTFICQVIISVIALVVGTISVSAETWTTLSSQKNVRRLHVINDTLYAVTSGGLLSITDPTRSGELFTNLNGLGTIDLWDIISDADGQFWVAGQGRLVRWSRQSSRQYFFQDQDGALFTVYCIADDGNRLWLGTSIGLVAFDKTENGGQIADSYTLFGNLNPSPAVYDVLVTVDSIWIATSGGLAAADRNDVNLLKSPANWAAYGIGDYPTLFTDTVTRLEFFEGKSYVGTAEGLTELLRSPGDTTFTSVFGRGGMIYDLVTQNDTLFIYSDSGIATIKNGVLARRSSPSGVRVVTGTSYQGSQWIGSKSRGMYIDAGSGYLQYIFTGSPDNVATDITYSADGKLIGLFYSSGSAMYDTGQWTLAPIGIGSYTTVLAPDPTDTADTYFAGTFGNGMWRVRGDTRTNFDENNSTMRGVSENPAYVVVRDMVSDGQYLFVACYRALNNAPIALARIDSMDVPSGWTALGSSQGITDAFVVGVDYKGGVLAVATESNGIFRVRMLGDLFDLSDDVVHHLTEENAFLRSNAVRVVKFAPDNVLWAGTNFGLSWFNELRGDPGQFENVELPAGLGPDITALEFDSRGNLWIGTKTGLGFLDAKTGEIIHYTALNSGLVSDDISGLKINSRTGDLAIGTSGGISILSSLFGPQTSELEAVVAFPNPFVVTGGGERLQFNFAQSFQLQIFTLAGELVYETDQQFWNGRNASGEPVTSGVYFYILTDESGNIGTGKVLLVRQ